MHPSLPPRERGLKQTDSLQLIPKSYKSLPPRERGLKRVLWRKGSSRICRRSPRGSVD